MRNAEKPQLERMKQLLHEEAEETLQFGEETKAATKKIIKMNVEQ